MSIILVATAWVANVNAWIVFLVYSFCPWPCAEFSRKAAVGQAANMPQVVAINLIVVVVRCTRDKKTGQHRNTRVIS
eukprot:2558841-Amphidinium_carterae.1